MFSRAARIVARHACSRCPIVAGPCQFESDPGKEGKLSGDKPVSFREKMIIFVRRTNYESVFAAIFKPRKHTPPRA